MTPEQITKMAKRASELDLNPNQAFNDFLTRFTQLVRNAALAEPVAYWVPKAEQFCIPPKKGRPFAKAWEPLYTSPPPPADVPLLSDDEVANIRKRNQAHNEFARAMKDELTRLFTPLSEVHNDTTDRMPRLTDAVKNEMIDHVIYKRWSIVDLINNIERALNK